MREAKRRLDEQRAEEARPVPRSRPARLKEAKRRLEEELWTEGRANEAYEAYRARGRMKDGRRFGRPPDPYRPPETPAGKINLSDPDSRLVKGVRGHVQGYNAQATTTEDQIVIAAEVTVDTGDFGHLEPMVTAARDELHGAGVNDTPEVVLADAGYWHREQMDRSVTPASKCSSRRTPAPARAPVPAGTAAPTPSCASPLNRSRRRALRTAQADDRAGLWRHQVQPRHRPLLQTRQGRRPRGMAADHRHPQPPQALAAHHRPRDRLKPTAGRRGRRSERSR